MEFELSREEVLKIAKECGFDLHWHGDGKLNITMRQFERAIAAIYSKGFAAGAESERAVSDKLLESLKEASESLRGYDCLTVAESCERAIAEVEAMRKENK